MEDEMDMEDQLEREMAAEEEEQLVQMALDHEYANQNPLCKEFSLPADFTFKSLPPSPLYQSKIYFVKLWILFQITFERKYSTNFFLILQQVKDGDFLSTLGAVDRPNRQSCRHKDGVKPSKNRIYSFLRH